MILIRLIPMLRIGIILLLITLGLFAPRWLLRHRYAERILDPQDAPHRPIAIVLGAGLRRDGRPTTVLADRVQTAVSLYHAGKVSMLLMSGSVSSDKDEPAAMRQLALELGVSADDILIDQEGIRTFETCLRAATIYNIDQALVITQRFHLPRALALCEAHDVDAIGISADLRTYRANAFWNLREIPASIRALWDVFRQNSDDKQNPTNIGSQEPNCG